MAKYVSEDGVKAIRDWVKVHDNKSLYNLGYYDTYDASTNTITRQTGYLNANNLNWQTDSSSNGYYRYYSYVNISTSGNSGSQTFISNIAKTSYIEPSKNGIDLQKTSDGKIFVGYASTSSMTSAQINALNIQIQYKLATSYTEEIIEGQPLITLDQQGSQWLRNEWGKGLNLGSLPNRTGRWWVTKQDDISEFINQLPNGTYNISADVTPLSIDSGYNVTSCFFWLQIYGGQYSSGDGINTVIDNFTSLNQTRRGYLTFTKQSYTNYEFRLWGFGNHGGGNHGVGKCSNIMLVEGDHPYPYQPYNQNKHITNNEAEFLKTESDRSANLFNNPYNYSGTNNGVSINLVGNECILNGTSTNGYYNNLGSVTLKAGTYTFNQVILSGSINGNMEHVKFGLNKNDDLFPLNVYKGTYTLTEDTSVDVVVWFNQAGITFNNCKLAYMLNEGSTPLPYQPYEGKVVHEKDLSNKLGGYVTTNTAQTITGYKKISSIGIDTVNGATLGNAIMRQNTSTGEVILGSTVRPLRLWGNQTRPSYSKNDGVSYSDLALLSDVPSIYGVSQLYRHDIEFDILNGDGIKCTFWSTSNEKITDFSQIPYLAFSNIQVKNISNEKILNVVQWNSDGFRFYESDGTSTLIGDGYDGVTAYYINGEPQL